MMSHMWILSLVTNCLWSVSGSTELHILGLFPITGVWDGGQSLLNAAQLAVEDINQREDVLPGYNINLTWRDSNVSRDVTIGVVQLSCGIVMNGNIF